MKGLSVRDKKLLFVFVGIVVLLLCYTQVFLTTKEENATLETEIAQLQQEKAGLDEMYAKMDVYLAEQKDMEEEIKGILSRYPAEIRREDAIAYAKKMDEENQIPISLISMSDPVLVQSLQENNLYMLPVTYSFTGKYEDIKKVIGRIQKDKNKRTVTDLTLSYNEENGDLAGTMNVNLYYLDNTGKKYKEPQTSGTSQGKNNLFDSK
ncbi:MAG: hypothetical protein ACI4HI_16850 [Lachnospiraceae bacterium]